MSHNKRKISVVTLNIWGLPLWLAKDKKARIRAIAGALSMSDYDVVCLQEVWCNRDYKKIKYMVLSTLPHSHYFYSGINGSGLCVFSKWPIVYTFFHKWPLNGYVHMFHHGDWFGGKGIALARINVEGLQLNIYTAHLHAEYDTKNDRYFIHRLTQALDAGLFVHLTSQDAHLSVLAGDLNIEPWNLCYQLLVGMGGLKDCFEANVHSITGTNECSRNSYSRPEWVQQNPKGCRIDYILYRHKPNVQVKTLNYTFPLDDRVPCEQFSYSDHEAVLAELEVDLSPLTLSGDSGANVNSLPLGFVKALKEGLEVHTKGIETAKQSMVFYLGMSVLFLSLIMFILPKASNSFMFTLLTMFVTMMSFYCLVMATFWFKLEANAILASKKTLKSFLKSTVASATEQND